MSRELQDRSFEHSAYERPDQPWVCGWAAEGRPCREGPGPRGLCTVTHECTPVRRGDRWHCTRPEPFGGLCENGPLPGGTCCKPVARCQPERSIRAKRGRITRWTTAVAIALLTVAVTSNTGRDFISPGPVAEQHGPIEADCGSCHSAGSDTPALWFGAAFTSGSETSESQLCQKCHDLGESGLHPHAVAPADLARITEEAREVDGSGLAPITLALASLGPGPPTGTDGSIACATCHREHGGRDRDLTRLANSQCQICHENQFRSFGNGHPGFTQYPYMRRTRINFNHATHRKDHYPQKGDEFTCRGCHQPDRQGQVMLVSGFEKNCDSCHKQDVAVEDGLPFLQLPGIDTEALTDNGVQIGEWPLLADIDQDASLGPYLRILIPADPITVAAFDALPATPDELVPAALGVDPDEAQAVGQIVWAIKELFYKLSTEGLEGLREALDTGLGRSLDEAALAEFSANFDFALFSEATRAWFPNLGSEIRAQRDRRGDATEGYDLTAFPTRLVESPDLPAVDPVWGWRLDPDTVAIRFRPRGHSDLLLKSWLDAAVAPAEAAQIGAMEYALASLATSETDGKCVKCHSVDITPDERQVNWHQKRRDLKQRSFTRYVHRPHLIQPKLRDCVACHSMDGPAVAAEIAVPEAAPAPTDTEGGEAADASVAEAPAEAPPDAGTPSVDRSKGYAHGFEDRDPATFTSNFAPLDQATCRTCHQAGAASNSCLNCHNYHVHPAGLQGVQANSAPPDEADPTEADSES